MCKALAHVMVIINNRKSQALKFLLEGHLNKIMGCSVSTPSILFTIETMVTKKIMLQSTGAG
jgi:hypothetical protein